MEIAIYLQIVLAIAVIYGIVWLIGGAVRLDRAASASTRAAGTTSPARYQTNVRRSRKHKPHVVAEADEHGPMGEDPIDPAGV